MPITHSARKALRQSERRRVRNVSQMRAVSRVVKEYKQLVAGGKIGEASSYLPAVQKALDTASKVKLIKKNTASRLKSRLVKMGRPKSV